MSGRTATDTATETTTEATLLQQRWHGWGSPVGLGLFLVEIGGFLWLLAEALAILSSI